MNRSCVRIFSSSSTVGIRSIVPTCGTLSRFTNPFFSRTCRHTAFIMRRLRVKKLSPILIAGNWSSTRPPTGCIHDTNASFRSSRPIMSLVLGSRG